MYDILTLNKISKTGLERFTDEYQYGDAVENPQGIMVRSASMHEMEMPQSLLAIARAARASTIFRWISARKRALWFSTLPAPMPTRSRSWFWRGC